MHTVWTQSADLLEASDLKPMSWIAQTLHVPVSTFRRQGSAASYIHSLVRELANPSFLHIAKTSAAHVFLCKHNLTGFCPPG